MTPRTFQQFDALYQDSVKTVFEHLAREMQTELAAHQRIVTVWDPDSFERDKGVSGGSVQGRKLSGQFDGKTNRLGIST